MFYFYHRVGVSASAIAANCELRGPKRYSRGPIWDFLSGRAHLLIRMPSAEIKPEVTETPPRTPPMTAPGSLRSPPDRSICASMASAILRPGLPSTESSAARRGQSNCPDISHHPAAFVPG